MRFAVGIDLGTTNSAIAVMGPAGTPTVVTNAEGDPTTPSVVVFQDFGMADEPLVGLMAKHLVAAAPDEAVCDVKRHMGNPTWVFDSPAGHRYGAEEISALVLKKLKQDAEARLDTTISDVVITVPAYFDDARRVATRNAGEIAGLNVLRVLNEPTAAALAYGLQHETNGTVLVYDLGGGTFDVSILRINGGDFKVLATDGDRNLGGNDFDDALIRLIAQEAFGDGASVQLQNMTLVADLRVKAELAKKALSSVKKHNIQFVHEGQNYKVTITRSQFEKETEKLLRITRELVEDTLQEARLGWQDIDHILLVGGSTRMPAVKQMIEQLSGKQAALDVNPDEIVALGAAVQAEITHQGGWDQADGQPNAGVINGNPVGITDVTSMALSVILIEEETNKEKNQVVIPRNTQIPCSHTISAKTRIEHQNSIHIKVTQGDDPDPAFVSLIGEGYFAIPPCPKGTPLEITYHYDIDQTIFIEIFDGRSLARLGQFQIDRVANMSQAQVDVAKARLASLPVE